MLLSWSMLHISEASFEVRMLLQLTIKLFSMITIFLRVTLFELIRFLLGSQTSMNIMLITSEVILFSSKSLL